ncbi:MAG: hypothetical protein K9M81_05020 [Chthoniobacterales bacterium]|nr:hypothetical protein [Chthoniobacterales bacterium]
MFSNVKVFFLVSILFTTNILLLKAEEGSGSIDESIKIKVFCDFLNDSEKNHSCYDEKMMASHGDSMLLRSGVPGNYLFEALPFGGAEYTPLLFVSWNDMVQFCEWIKNTPSRFAPFLNCPVPSSTNIDPELRLNIPLFHLVNHDAKALEPVVNPELLASAGIEETIKHVVAGVFITLGIQAGWRNIYAPSTSSVQHERSFMFHESTIQLDQVKGVRKEENKVSFEEKKTLSLASFKEALDKYGAAKRFILVEENGNQTLAVRPVRGNAQWDNLKTINFLRRSLKEEYGPRARTIVSDVIGVSNLIGDNNYLSPERLRETLIRAEENKVFFQSNVPFLEPILVTKLERLLDLLHEAHFQYDKAKKQQETTREDLNKWKKNVQIQAKRTQENRESATKYSEGYDAIVHSARKLDEEWRTLYNSQSKRAVKEHSFGDWTQVFDAKREFKKSYNRARRTMSDFCSEFAKAIFYINEANNHPHILNLITIRELAECSQEALDETWKKISEAYKTLSRETNEIEESIREIETLWNKAATQAQLAEDSWSIGAKYATNVRLNEILERANRISESRYNLGHVTSKEAKFLCKSFVGSNFKKDLTDKKGQRLISEDGSKQSRLTEYKKPGEFTGLFGCRMANLQKKLKNDSWTNGHLTVSDIIFIPSSNHDLDDHYVISSEDEREGEDVSEF